MLEKFEGHENSDAVTSNAGEKNFEEWREGLKERIEKEADALYLLIEAKKNIDASLNPPKNEGTDQNFKENYFLGSSFFAIASIMQAVEKYKSDPSFYDSVIQMAQQLKERLGQK